MSDIKLIEHHIAQVKREVWEEAAVLLEEDCYGGPSVHLAQLGGDILLAHVKYAHNQNNIRLAKLCRVRAKEVQP